jgi:hypothetical protein
MALDLKLVKKNANVFGSPVYEEVVQYGTVAPGEYEYQPEYNSIKIDLGDGTFISARIRRDVVEAGIDPKKQVFTVAQFVAVKDASGEIDGREWSITKGEVRDMAY